MATLLEYWHYTGDDSYNDLVKQAIVHQAGEDRDLLPLNQTRQMGNDDHGFWGMTAMLAAEYVLPDPPSDQPQWLALAQAVFNEMVERWDEEHCSGGLRWQVFSFNVGWDYKNSVSNGCFFNIASRLARYTGDSSYADWANKIWDWEEKMGLVGDAFEMKDGVHIHEGRPCQDDTDPTEWSYNSGVWLYGAAVMADYSDDDGKWMQRTNGILKHGMKKFVKDDVVFEQLCEPYGTCDDDQRTFKGYYVRWLAGVATLHPSLSDKIKPLLRSTAEAAGKACSGQPSAPDSKYPMFEGHPNTACGFDWADGHDGTFGLYEQMNGVAALISSLPGKPPKSANSGGTSEGDPEAGVSDEEKTRVFKPITTGDRVAAGFLTSIVVVGIIGGSAFLVF